MGAYLIEDKKVVLPEYKDEYIDCYWSTLTPMIEPEMGEEEITEPDKVTEILKKCFTHFCSLWLEAIKEIPEAAFFLFCNDIHEDSIDLWLTLVDGQTLPISEEDFAVSRRTLKIILEQGCKLQLTGHRNFVEQVNEQADRYTKHLEKLMYLGSWCIALSEEVSNSQLFPKSKGVRIEGGLFTILTYQPYPELFKFVHQEHPKHNSNVQLSSSIYDFKTLLKDTMKVDYDVLASFINHKFLSPNYNYSITSIVPLLDGLHTELGYDKAFLTDFYEGLTVSERNVMSIEDCILKNQASERFMFRPILEYTIDDKKYNVIGYNKWAESFTVLATNCFPFGHYPEEWKKHKSIKDFVLKVSNEHDDILEAPIVAFLRQEGIKVDGKIKSLKTKSGNNIPIEIEGLGEIDLIFIDEPNKIVYVGECKHNRSRFDVNNWKRDYSNFVDKYETQLSNKEKWVKENLPIVAEHFEIIYGSQIDFNGYTVVAAFFINAPTIYMFNGKYRAFTFTDLKNIIAGTFEDVIFRITEKETGRTFDIEHPYFKNLSEKL